MFRGIIIISILVLSSSANAELRLNAVHPDEPADYTYNQRFSLQNSMKSLKQINSALNSFRDLTELAKKTISKEEVQKIGNTEWDTQYLGFKNWPDSVEGTLYKQDYLIKKLKYELALERIKSGQLSKAELDIAEKEVKRAEKLFQDLWDSFLIRD